MVRNCKIWFQKQEIIKDKIGQEKASEWVSVGKPVLAKISSATDRLYYEAARAGEENTKLFRIRYAFLPKDFNQVDYRILYNDKQYKIKQSPDVDERHQEVQLRGVAV